LKATRTPSNAFFLFLIDNAVKYTPPEGEVAGSLTDSNDFAVVKIQDSGTGIGEVDLPHIFERFYRADKARSPEMGGVGRKSGIFPCSNTCPVFCGRSWSLTAPFSMAA